jgi:prepilin-type N-terminal cleavage/methylation domain-containing protein
MSKIIRKPENESGFTLVEILVVILIIGILTAVAVPVFLNQKSKAVEAGMVEDMHTIKLAMENCATQSGGGSYPDLWIDWGQNTLPPCFSNIKLSDGTKTHSFDLGAYYPATGYKPGQHYCIEAASTKIAKRLYFRSDKGVADTQACQAQL